jgi:hypothetical protein
MSGGNKAGRSLASEVSLRTRPPPLKEVHLPRRLSNHHLPRYLLIEPSISAGKLIIPEFTMEFMTRSRFQAWKVAHEDVPDILSQLHNCLNSYIWAHEFDLNHRLKHRVPLPELHDKKGSCL